MCFLVYFFLTTQKKFQKNLFIYSKLLILENYLIYTSVRNTDHVTLICHPVSHPPSFVFYYIFWGQFFRSVKPYLSPIFVTWAIFVNSGQLVWIFLFWAIYYTKFQKRKILFSRKIIFVEWVSLKKEMIYISREQSRNSYFAHQCTNRNSHNKNTCSFK